MEKQKRIIIIDELRGVFIILMVLYHLFYSMSEVFSMSTGTRLLYIFSPFQPIIAGVFITVCGISSYFSRSNLKRGLRLLLIALGITAITYFVIPKQVITFGILHLLSVSILIFALIRGFLDKISVSLGAFVSVGLFLITYGVQYGYIGLYKLPFFNLPDIFYKTDVLFFLGFCSDKFLSSDYFPMLPYFFMFLFGTFLGRFIKTKSLPDFFYQTHSRFLSYIGKHTLVIYIFHQPIILAVLYALRYFQK